MNLWWVANICIEILLNILNYIVNFKDPQASPYPRNITDEQAIFSDQTTSEFGFPVMKQPDSTMLSRNDSWHLRDTYVH